VSHEIFNGLVDVVKASCSSFLFEPILSLYLFKFVESMYVRVCLKLFLFEFV